MNKVNEWFTRPVVIDQGIYYIYRLITYAALSTCMLHFVNWMVS